MQYFHIETDFLFVNIIFNWNLFVSNGWLCLGEAAVLTVYESRWINDTDWWIDWPKTNYSIEYVSVCVRIDHVSNHVINYLHSNLFDGAWSAANRNGFGSMWLSNLLRMLNSFWKTNTYAPTFPQISTYCSDSEYAIRHDFMGISVRSSWIYPTMSNCEISLANSSLSNHSLNGSRPLMLK